jgi:hypothetical protein
MAIPPTATPLPTSPSAGPPIFSLLLKILVCLLFPLPCWTKDDTLRQKLLQPPFGGKNP